MRCIQLRLHPLPAPAPSPPSSIRGFWAGNRDQPAGHRDQHMPQIPLDVRARLLPSSAVVIPRGDAGLGSDSGCPRRRRNRWKSGLNVPGVKSIAGHGHARNQPSNRINAERSPGRGRWAPAPRGPFPATPPALGAGLSPFPEGGTPCRAGGDIGCSQLNFHQVVFNSPKEGGRAGGGWFGGAGGELLCFILLCNRLITPDHAVTI